MPHVVIPEMNDLESFSGLRPHKKCFCFKISGFTLIINFSKKFFFLILYMHQCFACMCACEGVRSPGTVVTDMA